MSYIVIALILLLAFREFLSFKERKDMLDRLMSRNIQEYKDNVTPEENKLEPEDDGTADLEEAKEAILNGKEED